VLFDRGRRGLALKRLVIGRDRDWFNVFEVLITGSFTPGKKLLDRAVIGGSRVSVQIGTVKTSKNFFRVDGPARSMRIGAWKVWGATTTASSQSDIAVALYLNRRHAL
jgi:hypothetical protein